MDKEVEEAIIGDYVSVEDIEKYEKIYRQRKAENNLTDDVKFDYAWHLIKSHYKKDITKGIKIMEGLIEQGRDQRGYYYYMGLGHYKLEEYEEAKNCTDRVLQMEPNNRQAKQLSQLISKKLKRDGLVGMAMLGGAAAVGGVLAIGGMALVSLGIAKAAKK